MLSAKLNSVAASTPPNYIEDVFSTFLYTGNGSTQTITNGIDLSGKGGLVWMKGRSGATDHALYNTTRGATKDLVSNSTAVETTQSTGLTSFSSTGFSLGALAKLNTNTATYVSWTFRKQPKFFDVVTYTGNGANRTIAHNLGSVPGCIIVKRTDTTGRWYVYHRDIPTLDYLVLNTTASSVPSSTVWNNTSPTITNFTVGTNTEINASGSTYVAYLFAHDAGGFGRSGTDNVISCGSYTGNGSATGPVVSLGYEPQWLMVKNASDTGNWQIIDSMRGMPVGSADATLQANLSNAESSVDYVTPTATGFQVTSTSTEVNTNGNTYIYIAVRRGPMKTPTTGTSVFGLNARTGTGANATVTGGAGVSDAVLIKNRGAVDRDLFASRLTGTRYLETDSSAVELTPSGTTILQANPWDVMDGVKVGTTSTITNASANTYINYLFDRAPGFFDVVCYTGTGVVRTVPHNLGVAPELMIVKSRQTIADWAVYALSAAHAIFLNTSAGQVISNTYWNNNTPSSTGFIVSTNAAVNNSGTSYIAYLFASCPGVSNVGSYTGNGTSQTINCGFTGGARFVMIKRTDSTGDWYVWDSARGIVAGNDPYWSPNTLAAEVTTNDSVDTNSTGFVVNQVAATNINVTSATYIYLAIA